ncbi:MAG: metallophosphoesterase [Micropepsaceae bacterium]
MSYDVIGDIHGQAVKLEALFSKLGYSRKGAGWVPPQGRQAIFLGDLIDRGPEQVKVLNIVRSMIDEGHARSVMGNHEFNAIGYATRHTDEPNVFLRRRSAKNVAQHEEYLRQVGLNSPLHIELTEWFKTLPPILDLGGIRVVHAWWYEPFIETVRRHWPDGVPMPEEFLHDAYRNNSEQWNAMEGLTKGLEVELPTPYSFIDHSGQKRTMARTKWWHEAPISFRDVAIVEPGREHTIPEIPLPQEFLGAPVSGPPVFVGHYWMSGIPEPMSPKLACLDWSAAKDGPMVAYRWDGEQIIAPENFICAGA